MGPSNPSFKETPVHQPNVTINVLFYQLHIRRPAARITLAALRPLGLALHLPELAGSRLRPFPVFCDTVRKFPDVYVDFILAPRAWSWPFGLPAQRFLALPGNSVTRPVWELGGLQDSAARRYSVPVSGTQLTSAPDIRARRYAISRASSITFPSLGSVSIATNSTSPRSLVVSLIALAI
jgi:hypothetical protein